MTYIKYLARTTRFSSHKYKANTYIDWARHNIFLPPPTSFKSTFLSSSGFFIGAASAYVMYPLGANFGDITHNLLKEKIPFEKQTYQLFFGLGAVIPMASLGAIATQDKIKNHLVAPKDNSLLSEDIRQLQKKTHKYAYLMGLLSTVPQTYSVYAYSASVNMAYLFMPPTIIGTFIFNSTAEISLINRAITINRSHRDTNEVKKIKHLLKGRLENSIRVIQKSSDQEAIDLFNQTLGKIKALNNNFQIEAYNKSLESTDCDLNQVTKNTLKIFFNLNHPSSIAPSKESPIVKKGRYIAGGMGLLVGAASSYAYFTLAGHAVDLLCDHLHIIQSNEHREIFKLIFSTIAFIPNAVLAAVNTEQQFQNIYNKLFSKENVISDSSFSNVRTGVKILSYFIGALSATPLTYIQIENVMQNPSFIQKLLVVPTFLGPFCVRSNALQQLLTRFLDFGCYRFFSNKPDVMRDQLVKIVRTVNQSLSEVSDEHILNIYNELILEQENLVQIKELNIFNQTDCINEQSKLNNI